MVISCNELFSITITRACFALRTCAASTARQFLFPFLRNKPPFNLKANLILPPIKSTTSFYTKVRKYFVRVVQVLSRSHRSRYYSTKSCTTEHRSVAVTSKGACPFTTLLVSFQFFFPSGSFFVFLDFVFPAFQVWPFGRVDAPDARKTTTRAGRTETRSTAVISLAVFCSLTVGVACIDPVPLSLPQRPTQVRLSLRRRSPVLG